MRNGLESVAWLSDWAWSYRKPTEDWLEGSPEENGYPQGAHRHKVAFDRLSRAPWVPATDEDAFEALDEYLERRTDACMELEAQRREEFEATYGRAFHRRHEATRTTGERDYSALVGETLGEAPGSPADLNTSDWRGEHAAVLPNVDVELVAAALEAFETRLGRQVEDRLRAEANIHDAMVVANDVARQTWNWDTAPERVQALVIRLFAIQSALTRSAS